MHPGQHSTVCMCLSVPKPVSLGPLSRDAGAGCRSGTAFPGGSRGHGGAAEGGSTPFCKTCAESVCHVPQRQIKSFLQTIDMVT